MNSSAFNKIQIQVQSQTETRVLQKIFAVQDIITKYFKNDILIATKNHFYQGYVFPHKKQFVCASESKKSNFLKSKELIEIRFLCGMECVQKTHSVQSFFEKSFTKAASPIFIMVPYFYENPGTDDEYLIAYQFKFEVKISFFYTKNKINCSFFGYKPFANKAILKRKIKKILGSSIDIADINNIPDCTDSNCVLTHESKDFLPKNEITSAILSTIEHMKKGESYLANIAHTKYLQESNELFDAKLFLIKWFEKKSTFGFHFMCVQNEIGLSSFSPERFLIKKGYKIATQPIKGTQKISKPVLWKKRKEMYEHTMVVDLLRHDLNSVCVPGSVIVQEPFYIRMCPQFELMPPHRLTKQKFKLHPRALYKKSLLQMQTTIVGLLPPQNSYANLMTKMIPGGSITGTPKKRTCELIARYESRNRGYYTGIAGIIEISKDFDFAILIRSLFKGRHGVYTGVGAGITTLSRAEEEFDEFCLKLKSFL